MADLMHDQGVLRDILFEIAEIADRTARMIERGLHGCDKHEIARAIAAVSALRTPLLDIQNTNRSAPTHPYAVAMSSHDWKRS